MEPKTVRADAGQLPARHIDSHMASNALVAGTVVLTCDGALPVEYLNPGDRVITRDSGTAVLRAVLRLRQTRDLVAIRAGSLGSTRPDRDTLLPATQEILIRDWRAEALFGASRALVPAFRLVDGDFVRAAGRHEVETIALVFDSNHILYADGLELASTQPEPAMA